MRETCKGVNCKCGVISAGIFCTKSIITHCLVLLICLPPDYGAETNLTYNCLLKIITPTGGNGQYRHRSQAAAGPQGSSQMVVLAPGT